MKCVAPTLTQADEHVDRLRHILSLKQSLKAELAACNTKLQQFTVRDVFGWTFLSAGLRQLAFSCTAPAERLLGVLADACVLSGHTHDG